MSTTPTRQTETAYRGAPLANGLRPLILVFARSFSFTEHGDEYDTIRVKMRIYDTPGQPVARMLECSHRVRLGPGTLEKILSLEDARDMTVELARDYIEKTHFAGTGAGWRSLGDGSYPIVECDFGREMLIMSDSEKSGLGLTHILQGPMSPEFREKLHLLQNVHFYVETDPVAIQRAI